MNAVQLIALLGRPATDPSVEQALDHFKIRRRPEVELDEENPDGPVVRSQDWLKNRRAGVEFGFEEEASLSGHPVSKNGPYTMLLSQLYFYAEHPEVQPYVDELPFDLARRDNRQQARHKLVRFEPTRRSWVRDTWEVPECQLVVSYVDDGARIGFVLCALRVPPTPDEDDVTILPVLKDLLSVLGRRMDDPLLRKVVRPLGIDKYLQNRGDTVIALMRKEFGVELHFGGVKSMDAIALTNIFLFRDREEEARAWKGALPQGLAFDDSPEVMFRKMAQAPVDKTEEDFVGYALWHLPDFSLQIKYSTMYNWLLKLRIAGPGVWSGY
jgi:hypothetical protein